MKNGDSLFVLIKFYLQFWLKSWVYIVQTVFLFHRYLEKEGINDLSEVKQNLKEDQIKSIKVLWSFKQNLFMIGLHFTICLTSFLFSILVLILKNVTLWTKINSLKWKWEKFLDFILTLNLNKSCDRNEILWKKNNPFELRYPWLFYLKENLWNCEKEF